MVNMFIKCIRLGLLHSLARKFTPTKVEANKASVFGSSNCALFLCQPEASVCNCFCHGWQFDSFSHFGLPRLPIFFSTPHFRTEANWGLQIWALILGPPTARPAVWCSTNDWVFMSKISSGRPLFPLSVDIGANKSCVNVESCSEQPVWSSQMGIFPLECLYLWTQLNKTNQSLRLSHT